LNKEGTHNGPKLMTAARKIRKRKFFKRLPVD